MQFTKEELTNILALISIAPIKGSDALAVALIQDKINKMLAPAEQAPVGEKKGK